LRSITTVNFGIPATSPFSGLTPAQLDVRAGLPSRALNYCRRCSAMTEPEHEESKGRASMERAKPSKTSASSQTCRTQIAVPAQEVSDLSRNLAETCQTWPSSL
jgi:hypothetical protein